MEIATTAAANYVLTSQPMKSRPGRSVLLSMLLECFEYRAFKSMSISIIIIVIIALKFRVHAARNKGWDWGIDYLSQVE